MKHLKHIPDHPPEFEHMPHEGEYITVENTLKTEDEIRQWIEKNDLPWTEESLLKFWIGWYMHYRESGYRDIVAEEHIVNMWDEN